jgi:hypothetical protein
VVVLLFNSERVNEKTFRIVAWGREHLYVCILVQYGTVSVKGMSGPVDWTQARRLKYGQLICNSGADARRTVISPKRLLEMATRTRMFIT